MISSTEISNPGISSTGISSTGISSTEISRTIMLFSQGHIKYTCANYNPDVPDRIKKLGQNED